MKNIKGRKKLDLILDVLRIFSKGGILMYPLLILGIVGFAIIIERFMSLSIAKLFPEKILEQVLIFLKKGELDEALKIAKREDTISTRLVVFLIESFLKGRSSEDNLKLAADEIASVEIPKLEGLVNAIGAISSVAPILGFLGTVTGMIQVFEALALTGLGHPEILSKGISQALLTTAFGLSIAIPSLAAYWYFKSKISYIISELESLAIEVINLLLDIAREGRHNEF